MLHRMGRIARWSHRSRFIHLLMVDSEAWPDRS